MGSSPELDINNVNQKNQPTYWGQDVNNNPLWDQANKYSGMADSQANMANLILGGAGWPGSGGIPKTTSDSSSSGAKTPPPGAKTPPPGIKTTNNELAGGALVQDPEPVPGGEGGDPTPTPAWYMNGNETDPFNTSPVTNNTGEIATPTGGLYKSFTDLANGDRTADEQKVGGVYSGMMTNGGYSDAAKAAMQQSAASALSGQNSAAQDSMRRRMATTGNSAGGYGAMARLSGTNAATASNQARSNVIDWERKKQQDQLQGAAGMSAYNTQGRQNQQFGIQGLQGLMGSADQMSAGYYGALRDILGTKREDYTTVDTVNHSI